MDGIVALLGTLPWWAPLVVCPLLFVAGFVDAIGGGGGLISIPAYLFVGMDPHLVVGTNKLSSSMGTAVATLSFARTGYIDLALCIPCAALALLGSAAGSRLSLLASTQALTWFMLAVLPVIGFYVIRGKRLLGEGGPSRRSGGQADQEGVSPRQAFRRTVAVCAAISVCVGVYDGFYGPGTGTFLMLLLTGLGRLDLFRAAGVTKAVNLTTNVTALVFFLHGGTVLVWLGLLGGAFNIAGNYLGARLFSARGAAVVRPVILVVLAVFALRLVLQLAGIV